MDYPKSTPGVGLVDGLFVDENPTNGQPGSLIPAAWANALMAELLGVIKGAGIAPDEDDNAQLLRAIQVVAASDMKRAARVATTGPIALGGLQVVDGQQLVAGHRVLVKNQADASQNGIYTAAAGAWLRATDADEGTEMSPGHLLMVMVGAVNASTIWQMASQDQPTIGASALNYRLVFGRTGVPSGTYRSVRVDDLGRVTAGSNPDTLNGYGIQSASKEDAETGTDNAKPMTALRVLQSIAKNVVAATGAAAGICRFASLVEVVNGAAGYIAVCPLYLLSGYTAVFSSNGYIRFPTWLGGFTLQWSNAVLESNSITDYRYFPIAFSNTCWGAFIQLDPNSPGGFGGNHGTILQVVDNSKYLYSAGGTFGGSGYGSVFAFGR